MDNIPEAYMLISLFNVQDIQATFKKICIIISIIKQNYSFNQEIKLSGSVSLVQSAAALLPNKHLHTHEGHDAGTPGSQPHVIPLNHTPHKIIRSRCWNYRLSTPWHWPSQKYIWTPMSRHWNSVVIPGFQRHAICFDPTQHNTAALVRNATGLQQTN